MYCIHISDPNISVLSSNGRSNKREAMHHAKDDDPVLLEILFARERPTTRQQLPTDDCGN